MCLLLMAGDDKEAFGLPFFLGFGTNFIPSPLGSFYQGAAKPPTQQKIPSGNKHGWGAGTAEHPLP
jgi:hypothetical protein